MGAEAGKMLLFLILQLTSAAQPVYTGLVGDVDLDLEYWTPDFINSGEPMDPSCTLILTQECSANEISCDRGTSEKGCWLGNYCADMLLGCLDIAGEPVSGLPDAGWKSKKGKDEMSDALEKERQG